MLTQLIWLGIFFNSCNGAKILGVVPTASYSHQVVFQPIWRALSLRGHQVTVLTTNPMNDPTLANLTEIDLSSSYEVYNKNLQALINPDQKISMDFFKLAAAMIYDVSDHQLSHSEVKNLLTNQTEHFDLLMVEVQTISMTAFSLRFKCPFIGLISYVGTSNMYEAMGNPTHPILYPDFFFSTGQTETLLDRVVTFLFHFVGKLFYYLLWLPAEQSLVKKHFGENFPSLEEILTNMDMFFVNTDPIIGTARPLVPGVVQIGGETHRVSAKPLQTELKEILDNAQNGFIYFSLGTNMKSQFLTEEMRTAILETFSELPYTILWKFESDVLPNKPKNVYIYKWLPQQDILRHPNIKLFITQGGMQSLEEAIFERVPIVGIPFFGDQPLNVNKVVVSKGIGLSVKPMELTKESFSNAIVEVIKNPKYRKRIHELANLAQDEPMGGLEKAIWWTEYVLRHKGAKHFRSPLLDIPTYQYFLVDVFGFLFVVIAVFVCLTVKVVKITARLLKSICFKSKRKVE